MNIRFVAGVRCNSRPRFTAGRLSFRLVGGGGVLVAGAKPVNRGADYCWSKAAEYARRVQETSDEQERNFLCLMRDNWIIAANDFQMLEKGVRQETGHASDAAGKVRPAEPSAC